MKEELEQLVAELREQLQQAKEKPTTIRKLWNWCKPYIIPFILGVIVGVLSACGLSSAISIPQATTIEQQAAQGGAAVPFPNASPLPSPSNSLPGDWIEEIVDLPSMNISELPLPSNPQADDGQAPSTRLLRPLIRRMR